MRCLVLSLFNRVFLCFFLQSSDFLDVKLYAFFACLLLIWASNMWVILHFKILKANLCQTLSPLKDINEVSSSSSCLLKRVFDRGRYQTGLRLNIYSKFNVIRIIAASFKGTTKVETILDSQFGRHFQLPVSRCLNSDKLVHDLLCRQLMTSQIYEM